jgi:hypothetical protein
MKTEIKKVKHVFLREEIEAMNVKYRQAIKQIAVLESDFDSIKASYKAKLTEQESRTESIGALLDAGFEMQDKECVVFYKPAERRKYYYLTDPKIETEAEYLLEPAVTIEVMSAEDFQVELFEAEAKFNFKDVIPMFAWTDRDHVDLIVGNVGGLWSSALRGNIGSHKIEERLDAEQHAVKQRPDCVMTGINRFKKWAVEKLGRDNAKGFDAFLEEIWQKHKERAE